MVNVLLRAAFGAPSPLRRSRRRARTTSIQACMGRTDSSAVEAAIAPQPRIANAAALTNSSPGSGTGCRSPRRGSPSCRYPATGPTSRATRRITRIFAIGPQPKATGSARWRRTCSRISTFIARSFRQAISEGLRCVLRRRRSNKGPVAGFAFVRLRSCRAPSRLRQIGSALRARSSRSSSMPGAYPPLPPRVRWRASPRRTEVRWGRGARARTRFGRWAGPASRRRHDRR